MSTHAHRRRRSALVLVSALLLPLTACGAGRSAADSAPALQQRLDAVDAAITAHDYPGASSALTALRRATRQARAAGTLSRAQAAPILASATDLQSGLATLTQPTGQPTDQPTAQPTTSAPTVAPVAPADPTTSSSGQPGDDGPGKPDKPGKPPKSEKPGKPPKGPKPGKEHGGHEGHD